MLGERRSKAAFSAGFPEAVREETRQDSGHLPEEIMETEASLDGLDGGEETEENLQNDSLSEQTCEGQMHGKEDIWSEEEDIEAPLCTQKTGGRSLRTHDLFFASEDEGRDFQSVLQEIQAYLSKEYSNLVTGDGNEEIKAQIRRFAGKYIQDNRIQVPGKTTDELIDAIYSEMAEFGFLTKYIYGEGIEEIDVNAWDDVEVQYSGGVTEKLKEHFESPEHAINVIRRMLHVSGMVLDDASPSVLGHLSKNIRIAVLKTPLVDEDVGVAASIRIVNPQLRSIGNGSNGNITHYQNTILTIFGSMRQQQHSTGNAGNARSSLDNLQSRTKHIAGSIACTCQLTVGIAVLDNQTAQIKRVGYQLTGFFNSHAFFLTQLEQQLCILFLLGIVFRIDNGCLGNVTKSPLRCTSVDFSRIAQKNQVCNTICQNLIGSFQSAFFRTFRKNNALTIGFRTL